MKVPQRIIRKGQNQRKVNPTQDLPKVLMKVPQRIIQKGFQKRRANPTRVNQNMDLIKVLMKVPQMIIQKSIHQRKVNPTRDLMKVPQTKKRVLLKEIRKRKVHQEKKEERTQFAI